MTNDQVIVSREGCTFHVQLNRPDRGNALSNVLVKSLTSAVEAARADQSVRLLVLSGAGRHFCTGFDLSDLDHETDDSLLARFVRVELLLQSIYSAPFVTLARANGSIMGAGADLFAACAERWIVGEARLAFPGSGFGIVLGTTRLANLVGEEHAAQWVESGQTIDAKSACSSGLASRQLKAEEVDSELERLVARVSRLDEQAQKNIRIAIHASRCRRGATGNAEDLARLVQSAARRGLRDRILSYQKRIQRRS